MEPLSSAKTVDALAAQRFQMLEDIALELAGEIVFPTCFDLVVHIRNLMKNPDITLNEVTSAVSMDPLVSSKLLTMANSAAQNSGNPPLKNVKAAIQRLGLTAVRATSMAIAMRQMPLLTGLVEYSKMANQLWTHSLLTASACCIVARRMTKINEDDAYFAGLIHDIGAFYMLYRATRYPELAARPESLKYVVVQWHESIGLTLLDALQIPQDIIEATRDHDQLREAPDSPKNLKDIVYIGNVLAGSYFEWIFQDFDQTKIDQFSLGIQYTQLMDEIKEHARQCAISLA